MGMPLADSGGGAIERGGGLAGAAPWMIGGALALVVAAGVAAAGSAAAALAIAGGGVVVLGGALVRRARGGAGRGNARALLARAVDAGPEGCLITSAEGGLVYANQAYRLLIGHAGAGPPPTLAELVAGDGEGAERLRRIEEATLAGAVERDEVLVPLAGGERRWLSLRTHGLGAEPGVVVWSVADSTPRHQVQEVIRKEQERLADFLDNAPIGFFSVDGEGRFVFANNTLARWLGYAPEDMTGAGMRLQDIVVEGSTQDLGAGAESGAQSHRRQMRLKARDGKAVPVYVSQSLARGPGGEEQTRSVVLNLSQEQQWESALRDAEKRFRRFFDYAPIGIVMVDDQGRLVEANRAFHTMVGDAPGAQAGTPLVAFVSDDDRAEVAAQMEASLRGESAAGAIEVRLKGPKEPAVQLYISRLENAAGDEPDLVLHLIDTTEQKQLEIHFAQSQRLQAVGQLAGGIAHDFNNLLTAMIGFCDLLLLRHQAGDQSFADVMQIKQNANRAANLVRQLLAFSRQQTLQPKVLSITDVLAELSNLLRRLIGENIELKMVHGREVGLIKVDQGQFEQVVINLAVNARDAMARGGKLTIRTSNVAVPDPAHPRRGLMPDGDYVLIEVADTGCGIEDDDIDKIFEPFFTTKEVGAGTGLGLATVYGIVKQTGGFIFVDSAPAEGATFKIYLPRHHHREAVAEAAEMAVATDLTGKGTILLVEDEDAVRTFAGRALRSKGYTVLEADSGVSALDLVANHEERIDLLVSDVVMPHMDGPTLVRRARESWPDMKVILISGSAEETYRDSLDESDGVTFLPKPLSLHQLAGLVKNVMSAERA